MPFNNNLYGIKPISLSEHLNNKNILEEPTDRLSLRRDTFNRRRVARAGTPPDTSQIPNVPAPVTVPEIVPETEGTPVLENALALAQTIKGKPSGKVSKETKTPMKDYWSKSVMGKMPRDQFVALAGMLSSAFAPDTPQGRMGAAMARMAGPIYGERMRREYEAPEKALDIRLKTAQAKKAEAPERVSWTSIDPKTGKTTTHYGLIGERPKETITGIPAKGKKQKELEYYQSLTPEKQVEYTEFFDEADDDKTAEQKKFDWYKKLGSKDRELWDKTFGKKGTIDEGYTEPYQRKDGTWVQKSLKTGKIVSVPSKDVEDKVPSPVTWTTATKELKGRFGKQDAIGNIIITPELQHSHRISQKQLVKLKAVGVKPLDAINQAEDFARNIESRYFEYLEAAGRDKANIDKVKKAFKQKYGYTPRMKR